MGVIGIFTETSEMLLSVWESLHITWQVGVAVGSGHWRKQFRLWIMVETDDDHIRSIIMDDTELF